jgi:branched-chain amino acid transport system substrate-binding protein
MNEQGGVNGLKIRMVYEDSQLDPKKGVASFKKLVSVDRVLAVIGEVASTVTLAMAPQANRAQRVLISPISTAAEISAAGDYVFRIAPSDNLQAELLAKWVKEKGFNKVAILYLNNSWGVGLKDSFVGVFKSLGGSIVDVESCQEGDADLRTQLTRIKAAAPEAIFMPTYPNNGGMAIRQAGELGLKAQIFGGDTWSGKELVGVAGRAANGVMFQVPEQYRGGEYTKFAAAFKGAYRVEPDVNASSAYDTVYVLCEAMKNKGIEPAEVRDGLYAIKAFRGTTGDVTIDSNGDRLGMTYARKVVQGGKVVPWR